MTIANSVKSFAGNRISVVRHGNGVPASFHEIDSIGKKTISGNISMTPQGGKRSGEKRIKGF